jgi:hypothetical protein
MAASLSLRLVVMNFESCGGTSSTFRELMCLLHTEAVGPGEAVAACVLDPQMDRFAKLCPQSSQSCMRVRRCSMVVHKISNRTVEASVCDVLPIYIFLTASYKGDH